MVGREPGSRRTQISASATQGGGEQSKWKAAGSRRPWKTLRLPMEAIQELGFQPSESRNLKMSLTANPDEDARLVGSRHFFFVK